MNSKQTYLLALILIFSVNFSLNTSFGTADTERLVRFSPKAAMELAELMKYSDRGLAETAQRFKATTKVTIEPILSKAISPSLEEKKDNNREQLSNCFPSPLKALAMVSIFGISSMLVENTDEPVSSGDLVRIISDKEYKEMNQTYELEKTLHAKKQTLGHIVIFDPFVQKMNALKEVSDTLLFSLSQGNKDKNQKLKTQPSSAPILHVFFPLRKDHEKLNIERARLTEKEAKCVADRLVSLRVGQDVMHALRKDFREKGIEIPKYDDTPGGGGIASSKNTSQTNPLVPSLPNSALIRGTRPQSPILFKNQGHQ